MSNKKQFNFKKFQLDLWEDWVDWFKGKEQNWYEFTFFEVRFEDETHMGMKEFAIALIGLHAKVSWLYDPAKFAASTLGGQNDSDEDDDPPATAGQSQQQNPPSP